MFSKLAIFAFCYLAVFAVLMGNMPVQYLSLTWNPTYSDTNVARKYSIYNITMYASSEALDLTYPDSKAYSYGLPDGQQIQFWWGDDLVTWIPLSISPLQLASVKVLQVRHLTDQIFGIWYGWHRLEHSNTSLAKHIFKADLERNWDATMNASFFWSECEHKRLNMFIEPYNATWTIGEAWDNNHLNITASWEIDWNATHLSAWTVLGRLLSFQSPNLGIAGVGGIIFDTILATPFWVMTAILIIKIVQSFLPFIRGVDD